MSQACSRPEYQDRGDSFRWASLLRCMRFLHLAEPSEPPEGRKLSVSSVCIWCAGRWKSESACGTRWSRYRTMQQERVQSHHGDISDWRVSKRQGRRLCRCTGLVWARTTGPWQLPWPRQYQREVRRERSPWAASSRTRRHYPRLEVVSNYWHQRFSSAVWRHLHPIFSSL